MYTQDSLQLVYCKKYFNPAKIFVLRQFKMVTNRSTSGLKSVIKSLVAEKCKPCEIYRRMCDVYRQAYFNSENVYRSRNLFSPICSSVILELKEDWLIFIVKKKQQQTNAHQPTCLQIWSEFLKLREIVWKIFLVEGTGRNSGRFILLPQFGVRLKLH